MPTSLIIFLAVDAAVVIALVAVFVRRRSRGTDLLASQLAERAHPRPTGGISTAGATADATTAAGATTGGIATGGAATLEGQVADLLRRGRKIEAIKVYRQATGASLVDAKNAVERVEAGYPMPPGRAGVAAGGTVPPGAAPLDDATWQRLREQVRLGRKIQAIKEYRELTGVGLREAKDAIDAL